MSKSAVWNHFTKDSSGQSAKCKLCKAELKPVGGSTKGLLTHLLSKHEINLIERQSDESSSSSTITSQVTSQLADTDVSIPLPSTSKSHKSSMGPLNKYVVTDTEGTLGAYIARMCSRDGVPFKLFVTSPDM